MARVEFQISKNELTGKPVVRVALPAKATRDDIAKVQDYIFNEILDDIGLDKCPGCYSGLGGVFFEEQFQQVLRAEIPLSVG
ncbi:MAG TPA: hypothetical protein VFS21_33460 [Roseiflexaceae bacterium]|nr:hypothetical protein [Roseiflexaceae bacterium]